jgi:hypothetical protein
VPGEHRKPWDARLVEWMSRDSRKARQSGKLTPKQRGALLTLYAVLILVDTAIGDLRWTFAGGCLALLVTAALVASLSERRRDTPR